MNDSFVVYVFVACSVVVAIMVLGSYSLGKESEYNRHYNKCLQKNSELPYKQTIELCKKEME